ncbi:LLM class flavin-dependent oxidoreductase [Rhizobium phaseoli]|uniref:LLM class flavin-dependent oxidoreductase n=1 Tax=Rhizobium phaseoli TaxID=396 RepID=UPI001144100F
MVDQTVLVVGGAGYIGSHTCLDLANKGFKPVVFDNFSNGHREFVKWGPAEEGDIRDRVRLDAILEKHKPAAILHFAALIEVGQSVKDPVAFYDNNVVGTLTQRYERQEEYIRILRLAWTSTEPFDFDGEYYQFKQFCSAVRPTNGGAHLVARSGTDWRSLERHARSGLRGHDHGRCLARDRFCCDRRPADHLSRPRQGALQRIAPGGL